MNHRLVAFALIIGASVTFVASADTIYVASARDNLLRLTVADDGTDSLETFRVGDLIPSLHKDAQRGVAYAVGRTMNADGSYPLYRIDNAARGLPSLVPYSSLSQPFTATVRDGDSIFAFGRDENLWTIDVSDPNHPTETLVGSTGLESNSSALSGAAFDPTDETLYAASGVFDTLYSVDPTTSSTSKIGGFGIQAGTIGMDFFESELFLMVQNDSTLRAEIGILDPLDGSYSVRFDLGERSPERPTPTGLLIMASGPCGFASVCDGIDIAPTGAPDCKVDLQDLAMLLANFGLGEGATFDDGDIQPSGGDGDVDLLDLALMLSVFGTDCN